MGDLVVTEPKKSGFVICPVSDDGIACSVVLNRRHKNILNTFFIAESDPSAVLDFPAIGEKIGRVDLHFAGFPYHDNLSSRLLKTAPENTFWYSHHYWPKRGGGLLEEHGVRLILDPSFSSTSRLLTEKSKTADSFSGECAAFLSSGKFPESPFWKEWFFLSLAVRGEPGGMRRALAPLYAVQPERPSADPVLTGEGEKIYSSLKESILGGNVYIFPILGSRARACTLGVPRSFAPFFRVYCQLAFKELDCSLVVIFFDGEDQVAAIRDDRGENPVSSELLVNALSHVIEPERILLSDKNTIICPARGKITDTVARIVEGLSAAERPSE